MTPTVIWFVLRRLISATAFVIVVASTALLLIRFAPGDATTDLGMTVASREAAREAQVRLGLDRPPLVQLATWFGGLLRFDLGTSSRFSRPVSELVLGRATRTAVLGGLSLVLATLFGIPAGVWTGSRRRRYGVVFLSLFFVACPPILLTLALMYVSTVADGPVSSASGQLLLPLLALTLPTAAVIERLQSRATEESLAQPIAIAAAARGVPTRRLIWIHAFKQSLPTVLGIYGIIIATLFSGSIAVETMTAWPGLGRLLLDALMSRDVFLVAGCALMGAFLIAGGNLVADSARAIVDPRMREQG